MSNHTAINFSLPSARTPDSQGSATPSRSPSPVASVNLSQIDPDSVADGLVTSSSASRPASPVSQHTPALVGPAASGVTMRGSQMPCSYPQSTTSEHDERGAVHEDGETLHTVQTEETHAEPATGTPAPTTAPAPSAEQAAFKKDVATAKALSFTELHKKAADATKSARAAIKTTTMIGTAISLLLMGSGHVLAAAFVGPIFLGLGVGLSYLLRQRATKKDPAVEAFKETFRALPAAEQTDPNNLKAKQLYDFLTLSYTDQAKAYVNNVVKGVKNSYAQSKAAAAASRQIPADKTAPEGDTAA